MIRSVRSEEVLVPTEERSLRQLNEAGRGSAFVRQFHLLLWSLLFPKYFRLTRNNFDCPFFAPMAAGAFAVCLIFAFTLCTAQPTLGASMSLMLVALTAVAGLLLLYFFFQRSSTPKARCILFLIIHANWDLTHRD